MIKGKEDQGSNTTLKTSRWHELYTIINKETNKKISSLETEGDLSNSLFKYLHYLSRRNKEVRNCALCETGSNYEKYKLKDSNFMN